MDKKLPKYLSSLTYIYDISHLNEAPRDRLARIKHHESKTEHMTGQNKKDCIPHHTTTDPYLLWATPT